MAKQQHPKEQKHAEQQQDTTEYAYYNRYTVVDFLETKIENSGLLAIVDGKPVVLGPPSLANSIDDSQHTASLSDINSWICNSRQISINDAQELQCANGSTAQYISAGAYETVDFRETENLKLCALVSIYPILLIKRQNPDTKKYDNVVMMAHFHEGNAIGTHMESSLNATIEAFKKAGGGELDKTTSIMVIGGQQANITSKNGINVRTVLIAAIHRLGLHEKCKFNSSDSFILSDNNTTISVFTYDTGTQVMRSNLTAGIFDTISTKDPSFSTAEMIMTCRNGLSFKPYKLVCASINNLNVPAGFQIVDLQSQCNSLPDQSIINLQPAVQTSSQPPCLYDKVALVLESTFRTIDFSQNPSTILYCVANSTTAVIALLRNTKTQGGKIATMACFIPGNTDNIDYLEHNFSLIVNDFLEHGGQINGSYLELHSGFTAGSGDFEKSYLYSVCDKTAKQLVGSGCTVLGHRIPEVETSENENPATAMLAHKNSGMHIIRLHCSAMELTIKRHSNENPQFNNDSLGQAVEALLLCDKFSDQMMKQRNELASKEKVVMAPMEKVGRQLGY